MHTCFPLSTTLLPILGEPSRNSWVNSDRVVLPAGFWLQESSARTHRTGGPEPTTSHHRSGAPRLKPPGCKGDAHLLEEYGVVSTAEAISPNRYHSSPSSIGKEKIKICASDHLLENKRLLLNLLNSEESNT